MQTILGANGVIGRELSRVLPAFTDRVRQVSRTSLGIEATPYEQGIVAALKAARGG